MNSTEYLSSDFKQAFILSESPEMKVIWRRMLDCVVHALKREIKDRDERELLELITIAQGHSFGVRVENELTLKFSHTEKESAVGELVAYFARQKRLFDLDGAIDLRSFEIDCDGRLVMAAMERLKEIRDSGTEQEGDAIEA